MSKKTFVVLLGFVFLFSYKLALANLSITEIMYDLSGSDSISSKSREWIEIYNPDSEINIDATKWRFYDGTGNRTINNETNFSIPALSYIIFAGDKDTFLADHPNFSGTVYDTGIASLNNTGTTLKILDQDGNIVDSVTYSSSTGATGDDNSLQKKSGSWIAALSTPGIENETIIASPPVQIPSGVGGSSSVVNNPSTNETKPKVVEIPKIKTKITAKNLVFTGIPIEFKVNTTGYSNEVLYYGKYFWNFGDGDSKEIKVSDMTKFSHIFAYEGEYTVALEYFQNYFSEISDAYDKVNIKVIKADVSISKVGDEKDFFIEVSNNTSYEADLSRWIIVSNVKSFILPNNMILGAKKKTTLSPIITGFSFKDKDNLKLLNSQREIIFDYSSPIKKDEILEKNTNKLVTSKLENNEKVKSDIEIKKDTKKENLISNSTENDSKIKISEDNLSAEAIKSNESVGNNITYIIGFLFFLAISVFVVYFIRKHNKKNILVKNNSDFEILDE